MGNVLVASAMDAMCLWGCHGKIKLVDFSVNALRILCNCIHRKHPVDTLV